MEGEVINLSAEREKRAARRRRVEHLNGLALVSVFAVLAWASFWSARR